MEQTRIKMYITLASNSELEGRYPQNTPSHFFNFLSSELSFSASEYEVGVKRIIYHNNYKTIVNEYVEYDIGTRSGRNTNIKDALLQDSECDDSLIILNHTTYTTSDCLQWFPLTRISIEGVYDYKIKWHTKKPISILYGGDVPTISTSEKSISRDFWDDGDYIEETFLTPSRGEMFKIPHGFYKTIEELLTVIPVPQGVVMRVEEDRVVIDMENARNPITTLYLRNGLEYVLGFKNSVITGPGGVHKAEYKYNLNRGLFAIFVYSNFVDYSHVAHTKVPLLDIVSIPPALDPGEVVAIDNVNPVYTPVIAGNFQELEVKLCSDTGELIPFTDGKTLITLHFRSINSSS